MWDTKNSDGSCTQAHRHTNTHIRGSRCSSRSGNKLVRKAGDKRARAHCPGIRDEQRCENVTTNSPWSPNVTSPLSSTPLPSSCSAPVFPLFLICFAFSFSFALFPIYSLLFTVNCPSPLCPLLLPSHPLKLASLCFPHPLKRAERRGE